MTITLIQGDCLEILPTLEAGSIDLTVTSPPYDNLRTYGNGFDADRFDWHTIIKALYRVTNTGGVVVWVVADATIKGSETGTSFRQALWAMECGFNLHDTMIYKAAGTGAKGSCYSYWQAFEYMFIWSKGRPRVVNRIADRKNTSIGLVGQGRYREGGNSEKQHATKAIGTRDNVWRYTVGFMDKSDKTAHPAPFPEQLAHDHIVSWSNPGDVVFDPMMGSGTTGKMAVQTGRSFIGVEIDTGYFEIAKKRIEKAQMQPRLEI